MKRLHIIYMCALALLTASLAACQQDEEENNSARNAGGYVQLRIGVADAVTATRAAWNDDNAESTTDRSEMMYNWTVLLCDASGVIKYVYEGTPPDGHTANHNAEIDDVTDVLKVNTAIAAGYYTAYSFANISKTKLATLLGVDAVETGKTISGSGIDSKTVTINANAKTTVDIQKEDAFGLGSKGIPMSNKQSITVTGQNSKSDPQIIDLIVVRMVAKLEFVFFNNTKCGGDGEDLTVKSVSISGITKGTENNLKLLPNLNNNGSGHENEMTFTHGDIKPNLNTGVTTEEVKYTPAAAITVSAADGYDISKLPGNENGSSYAKKFVFYVNESQLASGKQFELNVELANGDYRYALVSTGDNSGLTVTKNPADPGGNENPTTTPVSETEDWTYIARNDYRVIPIVLDNYRLELVPYDFPAIGVYPVSVKTLDTNTNLHEILFHDYGHFHLVPHVYRGAAWAGTENNNAAYPWTGKDIDFSATKGNFTSTVWTLQNAGTAAAAADWTNSFSSFTTTGTGTNLAKDQELTAAVNSSSSTTKFYGAPGATGLPANNVYPSALPVYGANFDGEETHTVSGKTYSQGDFPMLDAETHWDPKAGKDYRPYIFGQIAPQEDNADKTVYHELKVNLYVNGQSVARQLIYRFYMHLKQDFGVSTSTSRQRGPRPCCHVHHQ